MLPITDREVEYRFKNLSCLVDKRFEISNLDLIRDMVNIMNIEDFFLMNKEENYLTKRYKIMLFQIWNDIV